MLLPGVPQAVLVWRFSDRMFVIGNIGSFQGWVYTVFYSGIEYINIIYGGSAVPDAPDCRFLSPTLGACNRTPVTSCSVP